MVTDDQIAVARDNGIIHPRLVAEVCDRVELGYAAACALLMQESSGGRNVWGHDDTWMAGYGDVTACNYMVYAAHRDRFGRQGVGPCQLTSSSYQAAADDLGGCWNPKANMQVGFGLIARWRNEGKTFHDCWRAYNGSEAYADQMDARYATWKQLLNV